MTRKNKQSSFETALKQLETVVKQMESGDASLEQSLEWFEEGMDLIKYCQGQLKDAEQTVQELIQKSTGDLVIKDTE
ncbi:MAG: exodeoxyribonuclease VII small subunit [Candidatus Marinimicrobia bacterium]|nr:exodeoxyribonuclease VII small subunit [Candidatus Neomarinimicrobiota bacterium]|tara:strand:- start:1287 stop:1517 length:231 start_codon:yes stop_codon:yes gene_type:complete